MSYKIYPVRILITLLTKFKLINGKQVLLKQLLTKHKKKKSLSSNKVIAEKLILIRYY